MSTKSVVFSGIQPSGMFHLGGYIGAMKNWVRMQDDHDCVFAVVDLHTITVRQENPALFRERCYDFLALYIACGLDPEKSILFCQSHVAEHAQLAWVLNCFTYMGEANRMTQFKDKSQKSSSQNISIGLFDYPVLMAADILLYQTKFVPVGADQKQHLELARDIALRFNGFYGNIFTIPEPYILSVSEGSRIMSLQDPSKKMSKSDQDQNGTLALLDKPEIIKKKIMRAVTDSGNEISYQKDRPGIANLLTIYAIVSGKNIAQLELEYRNAGYGKFKSALADAAVAFLTPIQARYYELRNDEQYLQQVLRAGAMKARERAAKTLQKVHAAVGFIEP